VPENPEERNAAYVKSIYASVHTLYLKDVQSTVARAVSGYLDWLRKDPASVETPEGRVKLAALDTLVIALGKANDAIHESAAASSNAFIAAGILENRHSSETVNAINLRRARENELTERLRLAITDVADYLSAVMPRELADQYGLLEKAYTRLAELETPDEPGDPHQTGNVPNPPGPG
jgi:hypothetical protein